MGILDNLERGLERVVNGAFAKTFRSGLQPVEITAALRRELDTKAAVVSRDRILVPNNFTVRLAPDDYERMKAMGRHAVWAPAVASRSRRLGSACRIVAARISPVNRQKWRLSRTQAGCRLRSVH